MDAVRLLQKIRRSGTFETLDSFSNYEKGDPERKEGGAFEFTKLVLAQMNAMINIINIPTKPHSTLNFHALVFL